MGACLALDIATTTGWAVHSHGMDRPFFGAIKFPSKTDDVGPLLVKLDQFLVDQHRMHKLTDIVFESSLIPGGKINPQTIYRLISMAGHVEFFAARIGVVPFKVNIPTWRKHFIGRPPEGGVWKKDKAKQASIDMCARYGWHTDIADAAEACGILDYYLSLCRNWPRPWRDKTLLGGILL